jgi:predicted DNA-binding transcriptional regulator AlpA
MERDNEIVAVLAALVQGDRWLSADACAAYLGQIKRRTFLESIACLPDFPKAMPLGKVKVWKKSEIEEWAETHRKQSSRVA